MTLSNEPTVRLTLHEWVAVRVDRKDLIWNNATQLQISWVRTSFSYMFWNSILNEKTAGVMTYENRLKTVTVDGTHRSKSCELPVYRFEFEDALFKLRGNFHDWCVKLFFKLQKPIPIYLQSAILDRGYFEGMEATEEGEQHRFCLNSQEQLYSFMWWALTEGKLV